MIEVKGLTKYYGRHMAIQDLTFDAQRGEILGFLGPNAAGKTTTLRILAGYMPPSQGTARIAGFDVLEQSLEVRKRIGYLPETVPLYPEMSVWEYLDYMGSLRRVEDLEERISEVLEEVQLEERAESYIGNLSKGLKQRVGLAQALLHEPEVLILDEPTIGLDPAQIIEVRHLIQKLGKDRTVLLSTHILSEAQQVCDRVLIINKGQLVAEDTPENLQAQISGADQLVVRASTETEALRDLISLIPEVTEVMPGEVEGEVFVMSVPGKDIRPEVARKIVEAGFDLLELRLAGLSLEDIFLQLTKENTHLKEGG
ncbi:MAG: MFS transporter [Chloroflexi bacterium RBG_16_48_8]|nr:MAG: MFS transporter [Chloroflexi bacterium RBG_16_48_8]